MTVMRSKAVRDYFNEQERLAGRPRKSDEHSTPSAWQPIETAPKDGEPFLGTYQWDDTGEWEVLRMCWIDYAGRFGDATYAPFIDSQTQPTHWMPLPAPPEKAT